jgi:GxxExxY protein
MDINELSGQVIGAAIEVHRHLGPGLLESAYEKCLCIELDLRNIPYERQKDVSFDYKGIPVDVGFRADLIVDKRLIVELKTRDIIPIDQAQLLTYLKLTHIKVGLLINFNVLVLKDGIKRMVN